MCHDVTGVYLSVQVKRKSIFYDQMTVWEVEPGGGPPAQVSGDCVTPHHTEPVCDRPRDSGTGYVLVVFVGL